MCQNFSASYTLFIRPVVTEKSVSDNDRSQKVHLLSSSEANKFQITDVLRRCSMRLR
ncbi:MAG: 50S ribosomal protein L23 [bacterium LCO1.1]|uniref:50S ribosomal protein L23 n=1 Tax=Candidatus Weimeria bifida TaxID=2599074 RepID=A0A6N7IWN1_9FIRM|nr:50S ribosomal protein L23 [Candidatus Weimeria bifida]